MFQAIICSEEEEGHEGKIDKKVVSRFRMIIIHYTETLKKDNPWLTVKMFNLGWKLVLLFCRPTRVFFFLLNLTGFLKTAIHRDWLRKSLLLWTMKMCYKRFVTVQCRSKISEQCTYRFDARRTRKQVFLILSKIDLFGLYILFSHFRPRDALMGIFLLFFH